MDDLLSSLVICPNVLEERHNLVLCSESMCEDLEKVRKVLREFIFLC